jgi:hypothetical protein
MSGMEQLNPEAASKLKADLRRTASGEYGDRPIDLSDPAHAYTVWIKNGPQGWIHVGSGANPAEIGNPLGIHMLHDPVIFQVSDDGRPEGDKVVMVRCSMG